MLARPSRRLASAFALRACAIVLGLCALGATFLPLSACSLGNIKRDDCSSNEQCVQTIGPASSCQDGFLDVLSVRGTFHLGQIRVGIGSSDQICQCKEVKITLNKPIAIQIDGEPWMQKPCVITIQRQPNPIKMLQRVVDVSGGIESEVSHLMEWAEENSVIDSKAHEILMKEFSKRVELRKRTHRHPYNPSSSSLRREILNNNSM